MSEQWVTVTERDGTAVVRLVGEIDLTNASEVGQSIARGCGAAPAVLIDLTAVSFLDSSGVRVLDTLVGEFDSHGVRTRLVVGESGVARMTLQLCAFRDDLLAIDVEQAAAELRG
ncbi:STAS domain-containing protein [Mangrovihabitans endophyticus]|uniref:STAS domain-containing protein n=1 Tax=Mangrovihabitans endophyticus TaxID=1751298 RepID=A0A8J3C422_9ACTN|nr:STAS domain-containing protein [Mangrovihabitans endophyticus]GGL14634.1 hypothetical protein GCM10012284_56710 [Mangrovihabitans endophyticus]